MGCLLAVALVPYRSADEAALGALPDDFEAQAVFILVPCSALEAVVARGSDRTALMRAARTLLSKADIEARYGCWLEGALREPDSGYDVFISYRWGDRDSVVAKAFYDYLGNFNVGAQQRAIATFLDTKRLRDGAEFQKSFSHALMSARVVCPILSADALKRMVKNEHDPAKVDNVLLEWILMSEFLDSGDAKVRVRSIFPLLIGQWDADMGQQSLWLSKVPSADGSVGGDGKTYLEALSDAVPEATLRLAEEICGALEVEPKKTRQFRGAGLRQIVGDTVMRHLGYNSWDEAAVAGDCAALETLARRMARKTWAGPLSQALCCISSSS
jgi:hypothetical protein